jgi:hypothetical protein
MLVGGALIVASTGAPASEPETPGNPLAFRRLNEAQYIHSIDDIFGPGIQIPGRFEPALRDGGLLAIGDAKVVVTPSGFEQYELRAREIAAQVLAEERRQRLLSCRPQAPSTFDEACARQFFGKYGRLLARRPLDKAELNVALSTARVATDQTGNYYKGLEAGLSRLLISPYFVFRVEASEPEPSGHGERLDSYSLASRLSFLLWDAPPDEPLLDAAASGALYRGAGLEHQINRMIASSKFEQGVRAFFSDMFGYDQFEGLTKEQSIYKKYVSQLAKDAKEQSLRTIVDLLVVKKGDYRDLFTTRKTFLNRNLASLYKVPVESAAFDGWMPYTFQPEDQRAGLLTLVGFLMLDPTHEGRSSPTIRGKWVRELLLCQSVPTPPANVNFSILQDTHNPLYKTARDRLTAHRDNPVCAGCHRITDPLGLAMENYDAIGQYRTGENGAIIDASGTFDDKPYRNAIELQAILRDDPALTSCLARRVYEYGVGHTVGTGDRDWLKYLDQQFASAGYKLPALMRTIAGSKAFRAISEHSAATHEVASN